MAKQVLSCTVNGEAVEVLVQPYVTLLDALREDMGLTGPKEGCGTGDCGACTVHVDGKVVASCLMLAMQARGRKVRTIEGLGHRRHDAASAAGRVRPPRRAPVRLLHPGRADGGGRAARGEPAALEEEIRYGIAGNLCRCTGYTEDGGRDQRGGGELASQRSAR